MPEATAATGGGSGTTVRKIQLQVGSPKEPLPGIGYALGQLRAIRVACDDAARAATGLWGVLRMNGMLQVGKGAAAATAQINGLTASAEAMRQVMADIGKMKPVAPLLGLESVTKQFASAEQLKQGDFASQRAVFKQTGSKTAIISDANAKILGITTQETPGELYSEANKLYNKQQSEQAKRTRDIQAQNERDTKASELRRMRTESAALADQVKNAKTLADQKEALWARQAKQEEIQRLRRQQSTEKEIGSYEADRAKRAKAIQKAGIESAERVAAEKEAARIEALNKQVRQNFEKNQRAVQQQMASAQRQYQMQLATIPSAAGKSSTQHAGIYGAQIQAAQNYIQQMRNVNAMLGVTAQQRTQIAAQIHRANLAIVHANTQLSGHQPGGALSFLFPGQGRWLQRGLSSWTPMGMFRNMLTAGGWMTAVGGFYAVVNTMQYSVKRMAEIELQTARLQQVFRGAGGSAKELADDVLKLAAAEGRGTEEAMGAAIAWSRLGLSRRQAAEATRVSLMAANVAEMSADEATQHLAAVMAAYKLQVSELESALGMLNQTSNTYRVTNKDLLTGISRVSGVAEQAGMSFAELQGIIAATVQKTGQTGPNIANALKTVLVRMNRPDVKEFMGERFNLYPTGSAKDLRDVWEIYSKANSETQRDIQLKLGAATQASRFRSIMESYPEAMRAAIMSLQNLSSAETENLLVTNTLIAAKNRLVSSWDRFANMGGTRGVTGALSGSLDWMSGIIAGTSNAMGQRPDSRKREFFDPRKANLLWQLVTTFGFGASKVGEAAFIPSRIKPVGDWLRTRGSEFWRTEMHKQMGKSAEPTTPDDKFQVSMQQIYDMEYRGKANEMRKAWFDTLARNWGDISDNKRQDIIKSLGGVLARGSLNQLSGATTEEAKVIFAEAGKSAEARKKEYYDSALANRQRQIERITREETASPEREKKLFELRKQQSDILNDLIEESVDWNKHQEAIVPVLEKQKALMGDISELAKSFGLSKAASEVLALELQVDSLASALKELKLDPEVQEEFSKERRVLQARLDYMNSAAGRAYAAAEERRSITSAMTQTAVGTSGYGVTEGEKLLKQREWIQAQLARYSDLTSLSEDDLVRKMVLENSLKNTQLDLAKRLLTNEQERKQTAVEMNREFQKSLLMAGPGDLLRKMAVASMAKGGKMTAGQFFALSPEARQDAFTLMGGDRMALLNRERGALQGQTLNVPQLQAQSVEIGSRTAQTAAVYASNVALGPERAEAFKKYQEALGEYQRRLKLGPSNAGEDWRMEEVQVDGQTKRLHYNIPETRKAVTDFWKAYRSIGDRSINIPSPVADATAVASQAAASAVGSLATQSTNAATTVGALTEAMRGLITAMAGFPIPPGAMQSTAPSAHMPPQGKGLRPIDMSPGGYTPQPLPFQLTKRY